MPAGRGVSSVTTSVVTKRRICEPHRAQSAVECLCFHSLTATTHAPARPTHKGATWEEKNKQTKKHTKESQPQLDTKASFILHQVLCHKYEFIYSF